MVGSPKHLSDLARIEADVRIICRRCGYEDDWTCDALARHLREIGGSTVWSEITRHLRCRRSACGSAALWALPVPYARRTANLPRRISAFDGHLIDTALKVLSGAAARSRGQSVAGLDVRLALLVIHRYARDRALVAAFWARASSDGRSVSEGLNDPLHAIRLRLVELGWLAPPVQLEELKFWPWNSPAPPGWRASPGKPRETANDEQDSEG